MADSLSNCLLSYSTDLHEQALNIIHKEHEDGISLDDADVRTVTQQFCGLRDCVFRLIGCAPFIVPNRIKSGQLASYTTLCAKRAGFNFQQYTAERDPNCAHNMSSILRLTHHPNV